MSTASSVIFSCAQRGQGRAEEKIYGHKCTCRVVDAMVHGAGPGVSVGRDGGPGGVTAATASAALLRVRVMHTCVRACQAAPQARAHARMCTPPHFGCSRTPKTTPHLVVHALHVAPHIRHRVQHVVERDRGEWALGRPGRLARGWEQLQRRRLWALCGSVRGSGWVGTRLQAMTKRMAQQLHAPAEGALVVHCTFTGSVLAGAEARFGLTGGSATARTRTQASLPFRTTAGATLPAHSVVASYQAAQGKVPKR